MDAYKTLFIAIFLLFTVSVTDAASRVYKSVDKDGNVIFTDVPPANAPDPVEIKEINAYSTPSESRTSRQTQAGEVPDLLGRFGEEADTDAETTLSYGSLRITAPTDDLAIRDNAGNLVVSVALSPGLNTANDHSFELLVDGKVVQSGAATQLKLSHVDRGTHTLVAQVVDAEGKVVIRSQAVTFHMLRFAP